jgi:hypothetical protein
MAQPSQMSLNDLFTTLDNPTLPFDDVREILENYRVEEQARMPGAAAVTIRNILDLRAGTRVLSMVLAMNRDPRVIQYVLERGHNPTTVAGALFIERVCSTNSNPATIDVLRDKNINFSNTTSTAFGTLLHSACAVQEYPDVVKRIVEITVEQSGESILDILSRPATGTKSHNLTPLDIARESNTHAPVMIQILELYPDTAMRLEKCKETKKALEKKKKSERSGASRSDIAKKLQLLDDVIMILENEERHGSKATMFFPWIIFFIIVCLLICGGILYVIM